MSEHSPDMSAKQALEWLESVPLNDYAMDCLRIVREERDDLLAACKKMSEWFANPDDWVGGGGPPVGELRTAIARAEEAK